MTILVLLVISALLFVLMAKAILTLLQDPSRSESEEVQRIRDDRLRLPPQLDADTEPEL